MRTKPKQRSSALDVELSQIFGDIIFDDILVEEAVREAKKAFTMIRQDVLYRNNDFLDMEDE